MKRGDEGSAMVEFTYLAVLLMVPLVYLLITVFQVQRAAFGTTEAARQAGRAFARADTVGLAEQRARAASDLALADQGVSPGQLRLQCVDGCLQPGSRVIVTVTTFVKIPLLGRVFGDRDRGAIRVEASHTEYVDRFKSG